MLWFIRSFLLLFLATTALVKTATAKTVHYDLTIEQKPVNVSGNQDVTFALSVNGGIPAPILQFTEGDDAEIVVHNKTQEETSIHWHGILLPNNMDGVPYVTNPPIKAGEDYTFKFPLRQHGTYWYHSHTHTQEQRGVYGAIVIYPKQAQEKLSADTVLVLSDWIDENPNDVEQNLHKDAGFYLYKKGTMTSWLGALKAQRDDVPAIKNYFLSEWSRMGAMDFSDVGYDAFLINGKQSKHILADARKGQKLKFRVINAGASSYFYFSIAGLPFQVVAADGKEIKPVMTKELLIGMAETYDVIFTMPEDKVYEIRASSQDGIGFASTMIGQGRFVAAPTKPMPNPYAMNHASHAGHADHSGHHEHAHHDAHSEHSTHEEKILESLTYNDLQSLTPTTLPKPPTQELKLTLGGSMERYFWTINGKSISEDRFINIKEGDVIKFVFVNETMMHHPMHLHGHFFRVLREGTDQKFAPLKHTVDVPPFSTQEIEFYANEPGQWLLHCHNLYHMMSGMARVVNYEGFTPAPEIHNLQHHDPHGHDPLYWTARAQIFTHGGEMNARVNNTRTQFEERLEIKREDQWNPEVDLFGRHWLDNYTNLFIGAEYFDGLKGDNVARGLLGVQYTLPLLIEASVMVGSNLRPRLDLEKRFQWTERVYTDADFRLRWLGSYGDSYDFANQKSIDWAINLMYSLSWHWAVGFRFDPHSAGIGFSAQL